MGTKPVGNRGMDVIAFTLMEGRGRFMNKYVIWGAGFRGEKLKELLTKERIVAFIDSDLSKVGKR